MPLRPGDRLLHYRLVERIGEGGMGVVWRAEDTTLGRQVAIKLLPERFAADRAYVSRFEREAKTLAALNDPGIASIYSVHLEGDTPFLAMELVAGEPLTERIAPGGMALDAIYDVAEALADAVAAAHAAGVVHRDLKPDNVMLDPRSRVKVLDFGLAKTTELSPDDETRAGTVTSAGAILGTVTYMSPEQAEGLPVDARSDVFTLGTMLYEMATGARPFEGSTPISTITAILRDAPRPVVELRREVPAALAAIIARCLEKDPGRRFADAGELRDALRTARRKPAASPPTTPTGRHRTLGIVAGIAVVVVLAAAAWIWMHRPAHPDGSAADRIVAVMGFENLTDPADAEKLGRVLMGLVTTDLVESRGLEVLSTARVLSAIREAGGAIDAGFDLSVASRAATLAGADLMLVGQVHREGERVTLAAELVDVASGKTSASLKREAGSSAELFELAGSIATEIRRRLGAPAAGTGATPFDLAASLTSSPDAYRQYAAGELELHLSHFDVAARHFETAIGLDPEFALAYYRLSMALSWAGRPQDSHAAIDRGLAHIDRLPDHWQRLYRAYIDYERGRWVEAHDSLTTLVDEQVPIADLYYVLSEIVTHASRYWDPRRVRALSERTLELDPSFATAWFHLVQTYALADDRAAIRAAYETRRKQGTEASFEGELDLLQAERRWAEMERPYLALEAAKPKAAHKMLPAWLHVGQASHAIQTYRDLLGTPGVDDTTTRHALSISLTWVGQFVEARRLLEDVLANPERPDFPTSNYVLCAVRIDLLTGDLDRALKDAGRAREIDPDYGAVHYWLGHVRVERGEIAEAERALADLRALPAAIPSPVAPFWFDLLDAEVQIAHGDGDAALAALARIAARPPEDRDRPLEGLVRGRVLAAAGDTAGAIAAFREVIDPPYALAGEQATPWLGWPLYEVEALYPLALAEEAAGEKEQAREHLRRFVEHWSAAEGAVAHLAEARERSRR